MTMERPAEKIGTGESRPRRRVLSGVVVSNKMKDTISVAVTRYVKHPKYKKYVKKTATFLAHDAGNTRAPGEKVRIEECRPLSRRKRFVVLPN